LRQFRTRIAKGKDWLYSAPLGTTPSLVEMMQNTAAGKRLDTHWKRIADIKRQASILVFLSSNGIRDIEQLSAKVVHMHELHFARNITSLKTM
jgi:hypothetical protein